jgi:hypothetical protein
MLCPKCEAVRFPPAQAAGCAESVGDDNSHAKKAPTSAHRSARQTLKQPITTGSAPSSASGDTAASGIAVDVTADSSRFL